ncbi:MAG: OmpA family protein [Bacteroidaceae bacterium]|nr:OmpA family protein [Bacteroidaceae bacterium]
MARGEYYDAAAEYKVAYAKTATRERTRRGERALKMAECYRLINYTAKAIGAYQNGIRYVEKGHADLRKRNPDYVDEAADSSVAVTLAEATLKLARLQHKSGDYKNALISYHKFRQMIGTEAPGPDTEIPYIAVFDGYRALDTLAMNGITGCRLAQQWKLKPSLHTIGKEPILNSRRADFSPMLFGDEWDQLFITTTRPQAQGDEFSGITGTKPADIWLSKKDEKGKWQAPEPIEGELSSELDEGVCAFSPDGKTMYLTRCTTDPDYPRYARIYTSKRSDASWSKPTELVITRDTLSTIAHPAPSPDGRWLYFVSDMPGGHGGKDIWRAALDGAVVGAVENLGMPINSPGDEMFPTFRPNGDLYFSSDGHPGMGGLDIFCAHEDTLTHRWTVTNLGSPMNSSGDDFGLTFEGIHNRGFFSTNRGDARGWDHIMSFECPEVIQSVKGWVYELDGYELPSGLVYMIGNDGTNQKLSVRGDGSFTVEVQPTVDYIFLASCKGYLNHVQKVHIDTSSVSNEYTLQFPLASNSAPVLISNVYYAFNSAELDTTSSEALDRLAVLLTENPNVTIELSAHCDYRGNDEYNLLLSQKRAENVVSYLIGKGIEADRLTPKGYGESRPKRVKRRNAEQNPFLHEGDTLTEEYIMRLTPEQQEIANSLNRRTEFRVLRTTYGL